MNRRKWLQNSAFGCGALIAPNLTKSDQKWDNETPKLIRLNANENPYGPSQGALEAMRASLHKGNTYPVKRSGELINEIAQKFQLKEDSVMLGAGSTELLQLIGNWALLQNLPIITADLAFMVLPNFVKNLGGQVILSSMTNGLGLDLMAIKKDAQSAEGIVYLVNPNNPTGTSLSKADIEDFSKQIGNNYLVIDEAYIEYYDNSESMVDLIKENPKLIIVRTFSKIYGLAGMRIGYLLSHPETISVLKKYQAWPGVNLNTAGIAAAQASLTDTGFINVSRYKNEAVKKFTSVFLKTFSETVIPSAANFILFKCPMTNRDVDAVYAEQNMVVRTFEIKGEKWMRLTLGNQENMNLFKQIAENIWN